MLACVPAELRTVAKVRCNQCLLHLSVAKDAIATHVHSVHRRIDAQLCADQLLASCHFADKP
jgi:hypothetical protein